VHHPEGRGSEGRTLKGAGFGCYCTSGIERQALSCEREREGEDDDDDDEDKAKRRKQKTKKKWRYEEAPLEQPRWDFYFIFFSFLFGGWVCGTGCMHSFLTRKT
jgi:hypothetical protein